jgi:radical SAM superfamily enzyme YgiQ (UPF0313 family)
MSDQKILLILMPVFWPKMPPLGINYLKAFADSQGFSVQAWDLNNRFYNLASQDLKKEWLISCNTNLEENILKIVETTHPKEWRACLKAIADYDAVGFSVFKSNFKATQEVARRLKRLNPRVKILFGGPEIARRYFKADSKFNPPQKSPGFSPWDEWRCAFSAKGSEAPDFSPGNFTEFCDHVIVGEGERPFVEYLKKKTLPSLCAFQELPDLENLPYPRFDGLKQAVYPRPDAAALLFSRGCPRRCRFCSERLLYHSFRRRSVESLLDEIAFHKTRGVRYFVFHDSMFNADVKALNAFCDGVIKRFGSILWEAQIGVQRGMSLTLLKKIKKSGCYNLFIGLESGCDKTLKNMQKGFNKTEALSLFKNFKKADLNFGVSLIVGYPTETKEDFAESLGFILKNKDFIPKVEQINPFVPYDGTNVCVEKGAASYQEALGRMEVALKAFKEHGIRMTNAFVGNLIEKK